MNISEIKNHITPEAAKAKFKHMNQADMESAIERLQNAQKGRTPAHPFWRIAEAELAWFFVEMTRRQDAGEMTC